METRDIHIKRNKNTNHTNVNSTRVLMPIVLTLMLMPMQSRKCNDTRDYFRQYLDDVVGSSSDEDDIDER